MSLSDEIVRDIVRNENMLFKSLFETLTMFCFGEEIRTDAAVLPALAKAIPRMQAALHTVDAQDISILIALRIGVKMLGREKMNVKDDRRRCFEAALVMLYYPILLQKGLILRTTDELYDHYPEFRSADSSEADNLLRYRNFMFVSVRLIPPANHKYYLLDVVSRICEGRSAKYFVQNGVDTADEKLKKAHRYQIFHKECAAYLESVPSTSEHFGADHKRRCDPCDGVDGSGRHMRSRHLCEVDTVTESINNLQKHCMTPSSFDQGAVHESKCV
jgi:hypothetical protein